MNPEKRAHHIERTALRAAQKAMVRRGGEPLSRDEILSLRIQTYEPWKRILLAVSGAVLMGAGGALLTSSTNGNGVLALGAGLGLIGLFVFLAGLVGRRRTVNDSLADVGEVLAQGALEFLAAALD